MAAPRRSGRVAKSAQHLQECCPPPQALRSATHPESRATMFTGIVQATATIAAIHDRAGLRTFTLDFHEGFCQDLAIGASVAPDGVCLTVT